MPTARNQDLTQALKVLERVPVKTGIPSSEFIRIQRDKDGIKLALAAEVSGVVHVPLKDRWTLKGSFYIDRKVLTPFIFAGNKKRDVVFKLLGKKIIIKIGNRKLVLTNGPIAAGYIEPPTKNITPVILSDEIRKLISVGRYFGGIEEQAFPQIHCVFVSKTGNVMSTCETIVFYGRGKKEINKEIYLPLASVAVLDGAEIKRIGLTKQALLLDFECGSLIQAFPSQITKFPVTKIEQCITTKASKVAEFSANKLVELFKRFNNYLASSKDKFVSFIGDKEIVKIKAVAGNAIFSENILKDVKVFGNFEFELPLQAVSAFISFAAEHNQTISIRVDEDRYHLITPNMQLVVARRD